MHGRPAVRCGPSCCHSSSVMWGAKGVQQLQQYLVLGAVGSAVVAECIDIDHQLGNGSVGLKGVNVIAHLLDGAVGNSFSSGRMASPSSSFSLMPQILSRKRLQPLMDEVFQGSGLLKVADEHLVQAQGYRHRTQPQHRRG